MFRHEVAIVFSGPGSWAAVFGWEEEDCRPCSHMTHCTRNIVVMITPYWILIFNSMKLRNVIGSCSVCQVLLVFRIFSHTQIVSSAPDWEYQLPAEIPVVYYFCACYIRTGNLAPPVGGSSAFKSWWTFFTSWSWLSFRSHWSWNSIFPRKTVSSSQQLHKQLGRVPIMNFKVLAMTC